MKNLNLHMSYGDLSGIAEGNGWKAPRNVVDLTFSLGKLSKKFLIWERRSVVSHDIRIKEGPEFVSCGRQVELLGGGQLNILKLTAVNGTKEAVIGEGTPFCQTVSQPDTADRWFVWIGTPDEATLKTAAAADWELREHDSFTNAWKDISGRLKTYRPLMTM